MVLTHAILYLLYCRGTSNNLQMLKIRKSAKSAHLTPQFSGSTATAPLPPKHEQSLNMYQTFSVGHLLILGLDSRKGPFFTLWTSNQKMLVQPSEIFMHSDIYIDDAFQLFVAKLNPNHPPVSYCTSIFLRLTLLHAARNFLK